MLQLQTFQEYRDKNLEEIEKLALATAKQCSLTFYIHEPTPGIFIFTEENMFRGEPALSSVDQYGAIADKMEVSV